VEFSTSPIAVVFAPFHAGAAILAPRPGKRERSVIEDFRDLLRAFSAANVRFLVVGAHALGVHGVARATGDLDVWIESTPNNAKRVMAALTAFGAPTNELGIAEGDFVRADVVAQLGLPPYRIDILTSISGVEFDEAWADRAEAEVEGTTVPVIGRAAFIRNKQATGRTKDRADIESLGEQ
jgi:hypothetical protein